ncbi:hypothetical protein ACRALDRAFT_2024831 [Sodiomyces alcalophilus JCM 7366]|uniref:uncharacterized protein n=1 Tax=Sodiomyces alcalophilus JCM 7366 TaxID=591952 RepID=UPI0039B67E21
MPSENNNNKRPCPQGNDEAGPSKRPTTAATTGSKQATDTELSSKRCDCQSVRGRRREEAAATRQKMAEESLDLHRQTLAVQIQISETLEEILMLLTRTGHSA